MEPNIRSSKTLLTNPRINPTSRWSSSGCVRATILCVYQHTVCVCTGCVYTRCCVVVVCHFKGPVCLHSFPLNWDVIDVKSALLLWYFNASRRNCVHGIRRATGTVLVELRTTQNKFSVSRPFVSRRLLTRFALFWGFTQRRVVIPYRRFGTTCRSLLQGSSSPRLLDPWSRVVISYRRFGKLSVPSSRFKQSKTTWPLKIGPIGCPESSVWNYHSTLRKYHWLRCGSLKSRLLLSRK